MTTADRLDRLEAILMMLVGNVAVLVDLETNPHGSPVSSQDLRDTTWEIVSEVKKIRDEHEKK